MYKVAVITDENSSLGFNLTPVDTYVSNTPEEAKSNLLRLLNDDTIGVIAINDDFLKDIDERLQQRIDKLFKPIVVPIPAKKTLEITEERRSYLAHLIRRAIGFDIKLGD